MWGFLSCIIDADKRLDGLMQLFKLLRKCVEPLLLLEQHPAKLLDSPLLMSDADFKIQ